MLDQISDVEAHHVTTGLLGLIGNKGAIGISFCIGETTLLFLNCHQTAGQTKAETRKSSIQTIENCLSLTPSPPRRRESFQDDIKASDKFDACIWMGDFNFRLHEQPKVKVHSYVELKKLDQFQEMKEETDIFDKFEEGEISFPPTYKYKPGTDTYNTKRIPSWTDRILFKSKEG